MIWAIFMVLAVATGPIARADGLAPYRVKDGAIGRPLTGQTGNAVRGRELAASRVGNCLGCHRMPIPEQPFHGTAGPPLHGVGDRYSAGELRLRLVDSTLINPDTLMPPFYKVRGLNRVAPEYLGKSILNAQEIEDVIAYLLTLKDQ
jgi:L-cysteine S-thiosulfotransferase